MMLETHDTELTLTSFTTTNKLTGGKMSRIIALTNQKGGVGKTTTAVNLSAALGEAGQKVLLVDFDPQGNTTNGILKEGFKGEKTIYDLICGSAAPEECIIEEVSENVDLLPSNIDLSGLEIELLDMKDRYSNLKTALKDIRDDYDFVFIDCPPSIGMLTVNALACADGAMIPVQCEYFALEGLSQVLDTIALVRQNTNPELRVEGVVFTMYDFRTNLSEQVVNSVKESLNAKIFDTMIPRNVRLAEAPSFGESIITYDPYSRGADSYRRLAAELIENK